MKELIKRVDPACLSMWLAVYGGSLSVLAAYLVSLLVTGKVEE